MQKRGLGSFFSNETTVFRTAEKDKCLKSYFFELNFYILLMFEDVTQSKSFIFLNKIIISR